MRTNLYVVICVLVLKLDRVVRLVLNVRFRRTGKVFLSLITSLLITFCDKSFTTIFKGHGENKFRKFILSVIRLENKRETMAHNMNMTHRIKNIY